MIIFYNMEFNEEKDNIIRIIKNDDNNNKYKRS